MQTIEADAPLKNSYKQLFEEELTQFCSILKKTYGGQLESCRFTPCGPCALRPIFSSIVGEHEHAGLACCKRFMQRTGVLPYISVTNRVYKVEHTANFIDLQRLMQGRREWDAAALDDVIEISYQFRHGRRNTQNQFIWSEDNSEDKRFWGGLMLEFSSSALGRRVHAKIYNFSRHVQLYGVPLTEGGVRLAMETLQRILARFNPAECTVFSTAKNHRNTLTLENSKFDMNHYCAEELFNQFGETLQRDMERYGSLTSSMFSCILSVRSSRGRLHIVVTHENNEKCTISLSKTGRGLLCSTSVSARILAVHCLCEIILLYGSFWRPTSEAVYAFGRVNQRLSYGRPSPPPPTSEPVSLPPSSR